MRSRIWLTAALFACPAVYAAAQAQAPDSLRQIRAAHALSCGVIKEEEDYSRAEDHGNRAAFDLDMCKAVAVAVLGAGARFNVHVYPDEPAAVAALRAGEIEIVASASPSVENETRQALAFSRPTLYDGEGLMIPNNPAIHSAVELAGKKVCFLIGTATERGLREYAAREHIRYIWYPFSEAGEMEAAFFTGNCDALAGDVTQLANTRAIDPTRAHDFTILPQVLRRDPLAVAYWQGDPAFAAVVDWTVNALIEAEALGVTRANAATAYAGGSLPVQELLGRPLGTGTMLGLSERWAEQVLEATGNYGEMFDRDLGAGSPLRLDRGENRLWKDGGLMYPLPMGPE